MNTTNLRVKDSILRAACHSASNKDPTRQVTNMALLPLFRAKSNTVAPITHKMKTNEKAIDLLNPGKIFCSYL